MDGIKEGDFVHKGVPRGVVLHRVVLVRLAASGQFAVYFRLPGRPGYVPFIKKDGRSLRIWSDFDRVQQFCSTYAEYKGAYLVVPEGYRLLALLGIEGRPA